MGDPPQEGIRIEPGMIFEIWDGEKWVLTRIRRISDFALVGYLPDGGHLELCSGMPMRMFLRPSKPRVVRWTLFLFSKLSLIEADYRCVEIPEQWRSWATGQ